MNFKKLTSRKAKSVMTSSRRETRNILGRMSGATIHTRGATRILYSGLGARKKRFTAKPEIDPCG